MLSVGNRIYNFVYLTFELSGFFNEFFVPIFSSLKYFSTQIKMCF